MTSWHDLAPAEFMALAGGHGAPDTIRSLARAQQSKHLLLMKYVVEHWAGEPADRDRAVRLLAAAQRAAPEVVGDLLTDPLVGAWAARVTRRLRGGLPSRIPLSIECVHLTAITAAAAVFAGVEGEVTLRASGGGVVIPRLGRILVSDGPVVARIEANRLTVDGEAGREQFHRLAAAGDQSIQIILDDLSPYRGGHHAPPAGRVSAAEVGHWQHVFGAAWELLAVYAPARAAELAAGLRTLVPLQHLDDHSARSATIRDAFGAFGLTRPTAAADLAVMLVHEFAHSKLSGVLDIRPLHDPTVDELHFAPWRTDPRPPGGLLQGVYAFLGIADLWHRLRACPGLAERAEREFAVAREQVLWGLRGLDTSAALNDAGRRFVAGMRATADSLITERLPGTVVRQAKEALHGSYDAWQRRNAELLRG